MVEALDNVQTDLDPSVLQEAETVLAAIDAEYSAKVVGQANLKQALLIALLTQGHVLLESAPGLAKTTAAQTIAETIGGKFSRIQCTPDLLPSDILGTQIFDSKAQDFAVRLGPVHANMVLLDEINRSSAKTQSAMLEAMQERQTTIGGERFKLPDPFLVIATQNPIEQEGTYPLPEAQLDRFLLKETIDFPTPGEEFEILKRIDAGVLNSQRSSVKSVVTIEQILRLQEARAQVYLDDTLRKYIITLVHVTRKPENYLDQKIAGYLRFGVSPRATIAFSEAARAVALLNGRGHVLPEDIKALGYPVLRHRILLGYEAAVDGVTPETVIDAIFDAVQAP